MSVRSCFTFDEQEMNQEIRKETASDTDGRKTLVRRSSRLKGEIEKKISLRKQMRCLDLEQDILVL